MENTPPKIAAKWGYRQRPASTTNWESFLLTWERAHLIRTFIWSQECADEKTLFKQLLVRLKRFFNADFCFVALCEDNAKVLQAGLPDSAADRLPANFVRHTLDLVANSRLPIAWKQLGKDFGFNSVVVAPLLPEVGKPSGFLMLAHAQQRDFVQAELFLLQSVANELSWALRGLRMKQRQQKLLADVSHELKNSLNVIMGDCALLRENLASRLAPAECRALTSLDKMSEEILDLTRNVLDANSIREGKALIVEDNLGLVELLEDAFFPSREKAKAANVDLVIDYAQDLPAEVSTDPPRLKQVIRNLVNQAIEFSEHQVVQIAAKKKADVLEMTVSGFRHNNGELSPQDPAQWRSSAGRLELLKEQLEPLAGHLHVVSLAGLGDEVTLCLPCL